MAEIIAGPQILKHSSVALYRKYGRKRVRGRGAGHLCSTLAAEGVTANERRRTAQLSPGGSPRGVVGAALTPESSERLSPLARRQGLG